MVQLRWWPGSGNDPAYAEKRCWPGRFYIRRDRCSTCAGGSVFGAGRLPRTALRLEALTFHALAHELAIAANRFSFFAGTFFGWLLKITTQFHFPKHAFSLHLLLESAQRLINVIIADRYMHETRPPKQLCELTTQMAPGERAAPDQRAVCITRDCCLQRLDVQKSRVVRQRLDV